MRKPEDILDSELGKLIPKPSFIHLFYQINRGKVLKIIERIQNDAYNQGVDDCINNVTIKDVKIENGGVRAGGYCVFKEIDKDSLRKLKKSMIAYKLFRENSDGTYSPLFINRKQKLVIGEWYTSELHETKGYAVRQGWHCSESTELNHLSTKNRVWMKVEIEDYYKLKRPINQGGYWLIAKKMRIIEAI